MQRSLNEHDLDPLLQRLGSASGLPRYRDDDGLRQPVHTVYGGAQLFRRDAAARLGRLALKALDAQAPDAASFERAVGPLPESVYERVRAKLASEPVEDFRIDFEDGYGNRPDDEEDAEAVRCAREVGEGRREGTLPPFIGLRIKPLTPEHRRRSARTLDLFLTTLAETCGAGGLPENLVVTLPKVTAPVEVEVLAELLGRLEERLGLQAGRLVVELMVETPQSIFSPEGKAALPALVAAARGRCTGAHFGTYDYTASLGITAAHQHMTHPACDFARHVMQVSLAGTGIWLSDGATNVLPVAPHRSASGSLTQQQQQDNAAAVHAAWRLHFQHVRHSLSHAFYQGWDLHPAQLPTRYAAVYSFFLEGLEAAGRRLRNFVEQAARATLVGAVFDDAATGQGLLNFFLRAAGCGAVSAQEASRVSGLSLEELRSRSFLHILERRREVESGDR